VPAAKFSPEKSTVNGTSVIPNGGALLAIGAVKFVDVTTSEAGVVPGPIMLIK